MKKYSAIFPSLPLFIIGSVSFGLLGSIATIPAIPTWYAGLVKPAFSPPNWIFGPVWTVLFVLMGIAAFFVWHDGFGKKQVKTALIAFGIQFLLNILWSFAFFGAKNPLLGLFDIIALWISILVTAILFSRIRKISGLLLIPYILWVSFATILNAAIYSLNA